MKKIIAYSSSILAVATGVLLLYKSKSRLKFQKINVLDKSSLLFIIREIRQDFTKNFSVILKNNRKKRRGIFRDGREYRNLILELKVSSKDCLEHSLETILNKHGLNEDVLTESYKQFEDDREVKSAMGKLCSVEIERIPSGANSKLEHILEIYIERIEEMNETDPNELFVQMRLLEDEIFDYFGLEPEEIEAAVAKNPKRTENLARIINELNEILISKTDQELFLSN
jgi:hypothetical protein